MNVQMHHCEGFSELGYGFGQPPKLGSAAESEYRMASAVSYFKALGHITRLRCVHLMLERGTLSVGALVEALDESQPNISRHLGYLRSVGLATSCRRDQWIFYALNPSIPDWILEVIRKSCQNESGGQPSLAISD